MEDFTDPSTGLVRRRKMSGTYSIPSKNDGNSRSINNLSVNGSSKQN